MLFRTIVSAFFLETSADEDLATLAERAGMTDVVALDEEARRALGFHEPERQVLGGMWGAFRETWAIVDDVERIRCLQLYSPATRYLDAARAAREHDEADDGPLLAYVRTFRDACLSLDPMAAFLDTRPHYEDERWENKQGNPDWVRAQAKKVAKGDVDALADEHFSLLYLNEALTRRWTSDPVRDDRDLIDVPAGRLAFARSGRDRMA
jgi:hypothetical protein